VRPEKLEAEFSLNIIYQKRAQKGPNCFEDDNSYINLKISAEKYTSSPDIFDFSFPLRREIVCKIQ
jgi:hypothetical protein